MMLVRKLAIKSLMIGRKFEQSCILGWLLVLAAVCYTLSVTGISAKFHIGASLLHL